MMTETKRHALTLEELREFNDFDLLEVAIKNYLFLRDYIYAELLEILVDSDELNDAGNYYYISSLERYDEHEVMVVYGENNSGSLTSKVIKF